MQFQSEEFKDTQFSEYTPKQQAPLGLWRVDDTLAKNPTMRFQPTEARLIEYAFENHGQAPLEYVGTPTGLVKFLELLWLPKLAGSYAPPSKYASVAEIAGAVLHHLDYTEPYYMLVDMPVSLSANHYKYTYRIKTTGSILDPSKLEVFQVVRGWKFPHYARVKSIIEDPRTARVFAGDTTIPYPAKGRNMQVGDILNVIAETVWGTPAFIEGSVDEWMSFYYDDLKYHQAVDAREASAVSDAREIDFSFWYVCTLGVLAWIKSPHGLKFLTEYHPIYMEVLEWDHENQNIRVIPGTNGEAVIDGMCIFTHKDLDVLENTPPGTCCVMGVPLHCTRLVDANAIKHPICGCGRERPYLLDPEWSEERHRHHDHYLGACRETIQRYPEHAVFISYGALHNIKNNLPQGSTCPRTACPNTECGLHAGYMARVRALTDQRTKMLTSRA